MDRPIPPFPSSLPGGPIPSGAGLDLPRTLPGETEPLTLWAAALRPQVAAPDAGAATQRVVLPGGGVLLSGTDANDTLSGTDRDDVLAGGRGMDALYGLGGDDILLGGEGRDFLYGGAGADDMRGGTGNDDYFVDSVGDTVVELAGEGVDRVYAALATYALSAGVENLAAHAVDWAATFRAFHLTGNGLDNLIAGLNGTDLLEGGDGADALQGNGGDDWLDGGAGEDRLYGDVGGDRMDGGLGADLLQGGAGRDTYLVDNTGDRVVETASGDTDQVWTTLTTYVLPEHVETLDFKTLAAVTGTGNAGDNWISGGTQVRFFGLAGNDRLIGSGGGDLLDGGTGDDTLDGLTGSDRLQGSDGQDRLSGGDGSDDLYGGRGVDALLGDDGTDLLVGGEGHDQLDGGAGADRLYGDAQSGPLLLAGNDLLTGGGGADTMTGGDGADVFVFLALSDSAVVARDRITDFGHASGAGGDRLILSALNPAGPADHLIWSDKGPGAGHVWFDRTGAAAGTLSADLTGDGRADFAIDLDFHTAAAADGFGPGAVLL